jgi:site-specific DNA-adenine methylase
MKRPFIYFGGKSKIMPQVWQRLWSANVRNIVDPFFGGGSTLFHAPYWNWHTLEPTGDRLPVESVNDLDPYLSNFWRATATEEGAAQVAHHCDWPVNECDLHARHWWLVNQSEFRQRMKDDPDYYDPKIAGWWVWGINAWIGGGWCRIKETANWKQRPHLGDSGLGIHRPSQHLPHLGNPGQGIHRPSQKRPPLGNPGQGHLREYFAALRARFRYTRVCYGDFERVLGPSVTFTHGLTAIILDPPYLEETGRNMNLYATDTTRTDEQPPALRARNWALENGNNPLLRIALFGYSSEHDEHMSADWERLRWSASGGFDGQRTNGTNNNRHRETVWFSPHCKRPSMQDLPLFAELIA